MKKTLAVLIFYLVVIPCFSQSWVIGKVINVDSKQPIEKVHVVNLNGNTAVVSDEMGEFVFSISNKRKIKLSVTHVSYLSYENWIWLRANDTVFLTISLKPRVYELKVAETFAERVPEQMFHSLFHYVHDFEIIDQQLILITFNRSLKKDAKLTLCDLKENIIDEIALESDPEKLYKDFAGRVFVEYENHVQMVEIKGDTSLGLASVNARDYARSVKPCKDSVNNQILFSDQVWFLPRFNYLAFDIKDSMFFLLKQIVHTKVNHMMRWEYYDMTVDNQLKAMKMADHFPELDEKEIGGLMSGFQNTIYYEEPYAPIFVVNDTIMIFDHYSDYLYRFTNSLETIDSIEISYHKPQKRRTWKRHIYQDVKSDAFYGLYLKNGYSYLKQIDTKSGGVLASTKLQNQFVKKIKVHNDYAYYIYKPMSSPTKPFIYRELLSLAP